MLLELGLSLVGLEKYATAVTIAVALMGAAWMSPVIAIGLFIAAIALLTEDLEIYYKYLGKHETHTVFGHLMKWIESMDTAFNKFGKDHPMLAFLSDLALALERVAKAFEEASSKGEGFSAKIVSIETAILGPIFESWIAKHGGSVSGLMGNAERFNAIHSDPESFAANLGPERFGQDRALARAGMNFSSQTAINLVMSGVPRDLVEEFMSKVGPEIDKRNHIAQQYWSTASTPK